MDLLHALHILLILLHYYRFTTRSTQNTTTPLQTYYVQPSPSFSTLRLIIPPLFPSDVFTSQPSSDFLHPLLRRLHPSLRSLLVSDSKVLPCAPSLSPKTSLLHSAPSSSEAISSLGVCPHLEHLPTFALALLPSTQASVMKSHRKSAPSSPGSLLVAIFRNHKVMFECFPLYCPSLK